MVHLFGHLQNDGGLFSPIKLMGSSCKNIFILGATRAIRAFITVIPLDLCNQRFWLMIFSVNIVNKIFPGFTNIGIRGRRRNRISCTQCLLHFGQGSTLQNGLITLWGHCHGFQFNNPALMLNRRRFGLRRGCSTDQS